jgi:hypothetical protein
LASLVKFRLKRHSKAVAPVVATVILLAIFIAVVAAALSFATTELTGYYAQSDFQQSQTFALNLAQTVGSVGFSFGRSLSVGYGFKYASLALIPVAVRYNVAITTNSSGGCPKTCTFEAYSGFLLVAISGHLYSLKNGYTAIFYPSKYNRLASTGGSGSFAMAFTKEYQSGGPSGGDFIDTAVVPIPFALNSSLTSKFGSYASNVQNLTRIYLIQLSTVSQPLPLPTNCSVAVNPPNNKVVEYNESTGYLTVQGESQAVCSLADVQSVQISVNVMPSFSGVYGQFFVFPTQTMSLNPPHPLTNPRFGWQVEVFIGDVGVSGT